MNAYLLIILVSLLGVYALHFAARRLNARALNPDLPEEFRDVLDADRYARSQEYARANMKFTDVNETVNTALALAFILLGASTSWTWPCAPRAWAPFPPGCSISRPWE